MSGTTSAATPISGRERIQSLDVIRGVAVFGILLMNITTFGLPWSYLDPTIWGGATGANLWAWITTTMVFEGTQRGLFSILFGAGTILLIARLEAADEGKAADIFFRRSLWLVLFGTAHSYLLLWTGEILYYYGITALFIYALRNMTPRALLTIAVAGFIIGAIWSAGESYSAFQKRESALTAQAVVDAGGELTAEQERDIDDWAEIEKEYKPDELALTEEIETHKGSYLDVLIQQAPRNAHYQSWWLYRLFFDIFSMMLVGMALFKLGFFGAESSSRAYWAMALIGYPLGLAINYFELQIVLGGEFSILSYLQAYWTYDVGRLAMTLGHLGALLLFCRSGLFGWLQHSLAAVGRMALSNYVSHSIICAIVFYGFGFGLYADLERHQLYYVVVSIWIAQLIISPIWLRHYRFGPLEWAWRSLTYLQRQPFRRAGTPPALMPDTA